MKYLFLMLTLTFAIQFCANAQSYDNDEVENNSMITKVVDMYNTEFQWDEFKEKIGKAIVKNNYIDRGKQRGCIYLYGVAHKYEKRYLYRKVIYGAR